MDQEEGKPTFKQEELNSLHKVWEGDKDLQHIAEKLFIAYKADSIILFKRIWKSLVKLPKGYPTRAGGTMR